MPLRPLREKLADKPVLYGGEMTHVTVNPVGDILRGEMRNLRISLCQDVSKFLDEGFPLFFSKTINGF
ncbi:hypothetical protein PHLCEN_2v10897 [Hermanssonia centrifuga]|uniref:Uncharacterized protein n=1 Tax=Hermanssonia centrifuga TaxID=98765 RepID=A0A2R6NLI4_9APHY|nr:hypothetical protein PHLCEN_2v10897 [Hermanssonia centrifuga]